MFRLNGKNRKKASKEKNPNQVGKTSDNKQKYQEDFNEIILNDLVPEEKRSDFGLDSVEESKPKKSGKVKLNLGLGGKKSSSKGKKSPSNSKDTTNKKTKNSSKMDKSKQEKPKENSKKNSGNHLSKDKGSNKDTNKTTKKTKSLQSNTKEIKQELSQPIEQNNKSNKKTNIGLKKKRIKHSSKENDSERRSIDENYIIENNFDEVNFRGIEELEENSLEAELEEKQEKTKSEEPIKNRLGNLVWSEDKFPKK